MSVEWKENELHIARCHRKDKNRKREMLKSLWG
jgi:hypothetical protein